MSPEVEAALIAAGVGVLTVAATVIVQIIGFRATRANTEQQVKATHQDTADTLDHQREQLDRTLAEQREQLDRTLAEQRTRTMNDRFATAAEQLGSDKAAVRLAGVYAMAGLADDWEEDRQTCVDVLCAYLRMPYEPNPGQDVPETQRLAFQAIREVRHTVIRVITAHLRPDAAVTWHGLSFDFTGVVFDGGDFRGAEFSGGKVNFGGARFSGGTVDFSVTVFSGSMVDFSSARFSGGTVLFGHAEFTGGVVEFRTTEFSGAVVDFTEAEFSSGMVLFADARFCGGTALFTNAWFSGGTVDFGGAHLSGGRVYFGGALFSGGTVDFGTSRFSGGTVDFSRAEFHRGTVIFRYGHFSGGMVDFSTSRFLGGTVDFSSARFSGGTVLFSHAEFSGGTVDFSRAVDWSFPPAFPWTGTPPSGMKLPRKDGAVSLLPPAGPRAGTEVGSTTRINQVNPAYHDGHRPMGRTGMSGKQSYLYGTPTPITGVCTVCNSRAKLKKDGTMWSHRRKPSKPAVCQGSGIPPRPGSVKRKWPASTTRSPSLRAISGGAVESNRSHH